MANTFVPVNGTDQWIKGETYRFLYDVSHVKLFGVNIPEPLVPDWLRERLIKKQVADLIDKLRDDSRWEVHSYSLRGNDLEVTLIAQDNPFPIALVVGAIIGLALIFGITLALKEATKLIAAADKAFGGTLPLVPLLIGAAMLPFIKRQVK